MLNSIFSFYCLLVSANTVHSFLSATFHIPYAKPPSQPISLLRLQSTQQTRNIKDTEKENFGREQHTSGKERRKKNVLMDEFRTAEGELIEPYKTLKISRNASQGEVKKAYRQLSKKYHPDGARNRKFLPGSW